MVRTQRKEVTTHTPLCTVKGCPAPSDPDWHVPWCGHGLEGHHHHVKKRSQGGKGGYVVFICPRCHDKIDNGPWGNAVLDVPGVGKVYRIWGMHNETLLERVIEPAPKDEELEWQEAEREADDDIREGRVERFSTFEEAKAWLEQPEETLPAVKEETQLVDLSKYSDEQLATLFTWADKQQKDSFLTKCHIIHAYRERHVQAWGESWVENAYQLFEGAPSRRTLEAYANIWICVEADTSLLEHVGPLTDSRSLMQFIGRKKPEDGRVALEAAVAHYAEFGEAPTVPSLQHKLGEEAKPDLCPKTGLPHNWQRVCRDCGKER